MVLKDTTVPNVDKSDINTEKEGSLEEPET